MSDPAAKPDPIEHANAVLEPADARGADGSRVQPVISEDDLAIPDLTDEEQEAFVAALNE